MRGHQSRGGYVWSAVIRRIRTDAGLTDAGAASVPEAFLADLT